MDLYLYSKTPDLSYAATTLADLQSLIAALADPTISANARTIARVAVSIPPLVQGDTAEPLNLWSYDDAAGTVSSWITDPSVTLAAGLGTPDPAGAYAYSSTTSFTISGAKRVGSLALNTTALQSALRTALAASCRGPSAYGDVFTLHLRKNSAGSTETVARIPLFVAATVLTASPVAPTPAASYLTTAEITALLAGTVRSLPSITTLTGGGGSALDGLATAGSSTYPVNSVVLLSYGLVSQLWKLVAGTDATSPTATPAVVRPADFDATTNAVVWKQIG